MKKLLLFLLSISIFSLHSEMTPPLPPFQRQIVLFSVPKSGTHLIAKALELITGREVEWIAHSTWADPHVDPKKLDPNNPKILMHHLFSSFDFIKNDHSGRYIKIIQIRDPRDVLLSQIKWMAVCDWCWYAPRAYVHAFNQMPFDEKLKTAMFFPEEYYSVRFFFEKAKEWMQKPDVLVSRFEDLVGPQGGGDLLAQCKAIRELAKHIGCNLEQEEAEQIANKLFGGTRTFIKGQIGAWHEKFSKEHCELMKQAMGQTLIDFGYESSLEW